MPDVNVSPVAIILTAAAVFAALAALWRYLRKGREVVKTIKGDAIKVRDSINGRAAVLDSITGDEISPALPGMGQRMNTVERAVTTVEQAVIALADQHLKLDDHEGRIKALEEARVERVITRAESTQAWQTMEAAIKATPDEDE